MSLRLTAMLLAIAAIASAGCGSQGEDDASPLTHDQYQAQLDLAAGKLQRALRGVKTARTTRGLKFRLAAAERGLRATGADLRKQPAPKEAATAHASLVDAFDDLAGAASVNDEVCGGASALTQLSRTDAAAKVRSAGQDLDPLDYDTRRLNVRRRSQSNRRLGNGSIVSRSGAGSGAIRITNGGDTDALLKLVSGRRRTILGIYVRANAQASASGIPPGSFRVLFASGSDWDRARRGFTRDCRFTRLEDPANYRPGVTYSLTLTPTLGGTAQSDSIDEREFLGR